MIRENIWNQLHKKSSKLTKLWSFEHHQKLRQNNEKQQFNQSTVSCELNEVAHAKNKQTIVCDHGRLVTSLAKTATVEILKESF